MKPDPTRNTRAARYRAATKADGGAQINVRIGPEAAAVLARMRETMTVREAVEAALLAMNARRPEVFWGEVKRVMEDAITRRRSIHPPP